MAWKLQPLIRFEEPFMKHHCEWAANSFQSPLKALVKAWRPWGWNKWFSIDCGNTSHSADLFLLLKQHKIALNVYCNNIEHICNIEHSLSQWCRTEAIFCSSTSLSFSVRSGATGEDTLHVGFRDVLEVQMGFAAHDFEGSLKSGLSKSLSKLATSYIPEEDRIFFCVTVHHFELSELSCCLERIQCLKVEIWCIYREKS